MEAYVADYALPFDLLFTDVVRLVCRNLERVERTDTGQYGGGGTRGNLPRHPVASRALVGGTARPDREIIESKRRIPPEV